MAGSAICAEAVTLPDSENCLFYPRYPGIGRYDKQGNKRIFYVNESSYTFGWVDRITGSIEERVEGAYGKYPAKIFPVRTLPDGVKTVVRPVNENAARQFLKFKKIYSPDQIAQAKIKLHANISSKPVFCSDCHQRKGYLDLTALGFPPQRVAHLNSSEVVGLIDKYKTFYMPAEIDFGSGKELQ